MGLLKKIFGNSGVISQKKYKQYMKMLNGDIPIFSSYGKNIYSSDLVQSAIRTIANEVSKAQLRSLIKEENSIMDTMPKDSLNELFKCEPNPFMTMSDFLEKIIWLRELEKNVFIYPTYLNKSLIERNYTGLYILDPQEVSFYEINNKFYVKFLFTNGESSPYIPYNEIIHIRKDFSVNDMLGGNKNGSDDRREILKVLEANSKSIEGIGPAIESSLKMKGIITTKTSMDEKKLKKERELFEKRLEESTSGLVTTDVSVDVTPFDLNPKIIDKQTMDFIENKIFRNYKVSSSIVNGTATESERNLFYQQTILPILTKIEQAFTKVLFTKKQRLEGHYIGAFLNVLQTADIDTKIKFVDISSNIGMNTKNEFRNLFGYPPVDGGDVLIQSLNYIDSKIANDYQLKKIIGSKGDDKNGKNI